MSNKTILIVDDDPVQRRLMQSICEGETYKTEQAKSGDEALQKMEKISENISVIMLDLNMPGLSGQETLERLKIDYPAIPVIIITANSSVNIIVECMQKGAIDFFVKPVQKERVIVSLKNALNFKILQKEIVSLKKHASGDLGFDDLIGDAKTLQLPIKMGLKAAKSNIPVLITGESGVGKEVFSQAIRNASDRSGRPFISVNCGALPANLVESVLFGHEKGSFTGANNKHLGKFQEAHGGTIFLDEIGELPLDTQVKLLRTLQEGEVDPIGAKAPVKVDVRIISATNRDLLQEVEDGNFREDLFYRLNVFPICLPPLRERKEDIEALISFFIDRYNISENKNIKGIDQEALGVLKNYRWPGNIRQLENTIFRAMILCDTDILTVEDFPNLHNHSDYAKMKQSDKDLQNASQKETPPSGAEKASEENSELSSDILDQVKLTDAKGQLFNLAQVEKEIILNAIKHCDGNINEAAEKLGLDKETIYKKIEQLKDDENSQTKKAINE